MKKVLSLTSGWLCSLPALWLVAASLGVGGCQDPTIQVTYTIPEKYQGLVTTSTLKVYNVPPVDSDEGTAAEPLDCKALAFGKLDVNTLLADYEINVENGKKIPLTGINRTGNKIFLAEGRDEDGRLLVIACTVVKEINQSLKVELPGEPATNGAFLEESALPGVAAGLPATARLAVVDMLGESVAGVRVRWRVSQPAGQVQTGEVNSGPTGVAEIAVGAQQVPGPAVLEARMRWQEGEVRPLQGFRAPPRNSFQLTPPSPAAVLESFALGRLGPAGELGCAVIFRRTDLAALQVCQEQLKTCNEPCAIAADTVACQAACAAANQACPDIKRQLYVAYEGQATPALPRNLDVNWPDNNPGRAVLLLAEAGSGPDALNIITNRGWFTIEAPSTALSLRPYITLSSMDLAGAFDVGPCGEATDAGEAVLLSWEDGQYGVYGASRGAPQKTTPWSRLGAALPGGAVVARILATGCVAELDADVERRVAVVIDTAHRYYVLAEQAGVVTVAGWLDWISSVGFSSATLGSGRASFFVGRPGATASEVVRFSLRRNTGEQLVLEGEPPAPLLAAPAALGAGDMDGNLAAMDAPDVVALMALPDLEGVDRYYVQAVLAQGAGALPITGLMQLSGDQHPLGMRLLDVDGNRVDDIVVLSRLMEALVVDIFRMGPPLD